jgi:hypothetical protein
LEASLNVEELVTPLFLVLPLLLLLPSHFLPPGFSYSFQYLFLHFTVAMASAYDIPVIPHGSSVFSYHLQFSFPSCPMAEMIVLSPQADEIVPAFGNLFKDEPMPVDGWLDLPADKPGWGVELNTEKLQLLRPYDRSAENKS